jgi:hypothetical protein
MVNKGRGTPSFPKKKKKKRRVQRFKPHRIARKLPTSNENQL